MTSRYIGPSLWVVFASVLGLISYLLLSACDFGRPLFGFRYCQSQVSFPHTASRYEQERERSLKRHLHEAELRTAQLPVCIQKPQPEKPANPQRQPELESREPVVAPIPPAEEHLKFPTKPEDLKGCWQSDRGDIDLFTDEEVRKFVGKVRICLCFRNNGRGQVRYLYTDGRRCNGTITAKLGSDKFEIKQPETHCHVAIDYNCAKDAEGFATCTDYQHSRFHPGPGGPEKYHKVDISQCESRG